MSARFQGEWSDSYAPYFARKFVRRLGAEELHDAIALATDRPGDFKFGDNKVGLTLKLAGPPGARDVRTFLRTFGQSDRNTPPREVPGSLLHPLALMQSPVVTDRVIATEDRPPEEAARQLRQRSGGRRGCSWGRFRVHRRARRKRLLWRP